MLGRSYLKYRKCGDYLKIVFKRSDDAAALETAGLLLELFRTAVNGSWRRRELEEAVRNASSCGQELKFVQALAELLFKRVIWRSGLELHGDDFPARRSELFRRSGELLRSGRYLDFGDFRKALAVPDGMDIYGDLPENDIAGGLHETDEKGLLELYNMSQVQGVLMYARELEITFRRPDAVKLRNLFKYLKFCRLLADIRQLAGGGLKMKVSGPLSLLSDNRKYGLQLAVFFPAVVAMGEWRLRCEVELPGGVHPYRLVLEESSGLVSHYRHYSNYIPEEIKLFYHHFAENCSEYTIDCGADALKLKGGGMIVPDFTFTRVADGKKYYLELFHRYHASALLERMREFTAGELSEFHGLFIGIDRALVQPGSAVAEFVAGKSEKVFMFRDFPGVARVLKILAQLG